MSFFSESRLKFANATNLNRKPFPSNTPAEFDTASSPS
jgi:hypothetical protein